MAFLTFDLTARVFALNYARGERTYILLNSVHPRRSSLPLSARASNVRFAGREYLPPLFA